MAKIISRRGEEKAKREVIEDSVVVTEIFLYGIDGSNITLTDEELDHIRRVFDSIRKSLDSIAFEDCYAFSST